MSSGPEGIVRDQPTEMPSEGGPLLEYKGAVPPAPAWFQGAVATPYESHSVTVNGAQVRYAALTFSGMGESDWRETYDMATFSAEQMAVADDAGLFEAEVKPIIVAHSFGGFVTLVTGAEHGDRFTGMVIVDSPVNPPERPHRGPPRSGRPNRVYDDLASALGRFRLAPPQLCENHYAMDYIARWSLKKQDDGWTWKFDPSIWTHFEPNDAPGDMLKAAKCRIAIIRGEESDLMPDDVGDYMRKLLGHQVPFISIPHARHHVMLDQPLAFVSALRTLLAEWAHSEPHRSV